MINVTDTISRLENLIIDKIPVTRHLQFHIHLDEYDQPILEVPLQPNINHLGTAFGGSLSMLCTIEGWGCMYLLLEKYELIADILIQKNDMAFLSQVEDDFYVGCNLPAKPKLELFVRTFQRFGKARLPVTCYVKEKDKSETAALFNGLYAAVRS